MLLEGAAALMKSLCTASYTNEQSIVQEREASELNLLLLWPENCSCCSPKERVCWCPATLLLLARFRTLHHYQLVSLHELSERVSTENKGQR
jgi:hypothetical protein